MTSVSNLTNAAAGAASAANDKHELKAVPLPAVPSFAQVSSELPRYAQIPATEVFSEKLPRRQSDENINFSPNVAIPTSLSIDDVSVKLSEMTLTLPVVENPERAHRATLVDVPSMVDQTMVDRRIAQIDKVMLDLESMENFWTRSDLLLQDSWLNSYRGSFYEQKQNLVKAGECYKRALKIYAIALKLDRLTAKASPHIVSYYYLLKRYAHLLNDVRFPASMRDAKFATQLQDQMNIIRKDREKWGMPDPEQEDEPFSYPNTMLKILC